MSDSKPSSIDSSAENSRPLLNVIVLTFSFISVIALMVSSASRSARLLVNRLITVYKVLRSTDAGNRFSQDLVLLRFRALAVRSALLRKGIEVEGSISLGLFMPVVDNQSKNGRVEVWLAKKRIS